MTPKRYKFLLKKALEDALESVKSTDENVLYTTPVEIIQNNSIIIVEITNEKFNSSNINE